MISSGLMKKIIVCLSTRYDKSVTIIRQHLKVDDIESWGKVQRLEGGDTMRASELTKNQDDGRDASYVRVRIYYFFTMRLKINSFLISMNCLST